MASAKLELLFTAKDLASSAVRNLNTSLGGMAKTGAGLSGLAKTGFGLGAGLGVFSLATSSISGVGDAIGGMMEDARQDEVSVARLTASLKANVAGWQSHTGEIELAIHANQKLAFSDDETRGSLTLLVAATHDVNKALVIQRTAMDLARFKGISLEEATEALVKVEGGQFRALKNLGIVLHDGATQTQALAAVQKVAAGQTEAYGKTAAAATARLKDSLSELGEQVGRVTAPALADLANALTTLFRATGDAGEADKKIVVVTDDLQALTDTFLPFIWDLIPGLRTGLAGLGASFDTTSEKLGILSSQGHAAAAGLDATAASAVSLLPPIKDVVSWADKARAALADMGSGVGWHSGQFMIPSTTPTSSQGAEFRAEGGPASGLTVVGERGPELVNLPRGSEVFSNADSRVMLGSEVRAGRRGSSGGLTVIFNSTWPPTEAQAAEIARIVDRNLHYGLGIAAQTGSAT